MWLQVILISCVRSAIIVHHVREEKHSVAENQLQLRFWVVVVVELHQEPLSQSASIIFWTSGQDCSDGRQESIRMRLLGWRAAQAAAAAVAAVAPSRSWKRIQAEHEDDSTDLCGKAAHVDIDDIR